MSSPQINQNTSPDTGRVGAAPCVRPRTPVRAARTSKRILRSARTV